MTRAAIPILVSTITVFSLCWNTVIATSLGTPYGRERRTTKKALYQNSKYAKRRTRRVQEDETQQAADNGDLRTRGKGFNAEDIFEDTGTTDDDDELDLHDNSPAAAPVEAYVPGLPTRSPIPTAGPTPIIMIPPTVPTGADDDIITSDDRGVDEFEISTTEGEPAVPPPHCQTTFGVFGSLEGEAHTVYFGYELETNPQTQGILEQDVLPLLEIKLNDLILPSVFPRSCVAFEMRQRRQRHHRHLLIEGISASPDDVPIDGEECLEQLSVPDSNCALVRGALTIYVAFFHPDDFTRVLTALEATMQDYPSFDSLHPSIRRVSYVKMNEDGTGRAAAAGGAEGDSNGDETNKLVLPIAVAGAGALAIAIMAFAYNKSRQNDKNASLVGDDDNVLTGEPTTPPASAN